MAYKKKSFREAVNECNAVSVDEFFDELDNRIKKRFEDGVIVKDKNSERDLPLNKQPPQN